MGRAGCQEDEADLGEAEPTAPRGVRRRTARGHLARQVDGPSSSGAGTQREGVDPSILSVEPHAHGGSPRASHKPSSRERILPKVTARDISVGSSTYHKGFLEIHVHTCTLGSEKPRCRQTCLSCLIQCLEAT